MQSYEHKHLEYTKKLKVFRQMHSDYATACANALKSLLPETHHVNDLEHLFRNLRQPKGEDHKDGRLQGEHSIETVIAYIAFSAYLPTVLAFHLFWTVMFRVEVLRAGKKDS